MSSRKAPACFKQRSFKEGVYLVWKKRSTLSVVFARLLQKGEFVRSAKSIEGRETGNLNGPCQVQQKTNCPVEKRQPIVRISNAVISVQYLKNSAVYIYTLRSQSYFLSYPTAAQVDTCSASSETTASKILIGDRGVTPT